MRVYCLVLAMRNEPCIPARTNVEILSELREKQKRKREEMNAAQNLPNQMLPYEELRLRWLEFASPCPNPNPKEKDGKCGCTRGRRGLDGDAGPARWEVLRDLEQ
jgi:hypothetical protein